MTQSVYERAAGNSLNFASAPHARKECSCLLGFDIGAYNTCAHFCRYCYTNYSRQKVLENLINHDDNSPLLIGTPDSGDKIHNAVQFFWKTPQQPLDL